MNLKSLGLFVGTGRCNANCRHCAGIPHRRYAPKLDGIIDSKLIYQTLKSCHEMGARSLSLTSGGEPTLSPESVTKVLDLVGRCGVEGMHYSPINLYSNGIRIGQDEDFCREYLTEWKDKGLTCVYVTVHDPDEDENARIYCVKEYPRLETVISRIHEAGLKMRANIVLGKGTIYTYKKFTSTAERLMRLGSDKISCWPVRDAEDKADPKLAPPEETLDRIESWIIESGYNISLQRNNQEYSLGQKLTLFPNGKLSCNWCN